MATAWDQRSATERARYRDRQLTTWLPEALGFAPHWSAVADRVGITASGATTYGDLLRVPPSLLQDVVGRNGAGTSLVLRPTVAQVEADGRNLMGRVARALGGDDEEARYQTVLREYKPVHVVRGGRHGALAISSSRGDLDRSLDVGANVAELLGLDDHDYLVSAVPHGPHHDFWSMRTLGLGASMLALHPRGHGDDLAQCVGSFGVVPATVVAVRVDEAEAWAEEIAAGDADVSRVARIVLVGPPPDDDRRGAIVEAWRSAGALEDDLQALAVWSPSESRSLWSECDAGGRGLHVQPDHELLEVVQTSLRTDPGRTGDLTLTSIGWRGTALLRYRTGIAIDALEDDPCEACGRDLPRVPADLVDDAWYLELTRDGRTETLDTRRLAGALELLAAWRIELQRGEDGQDRLVAHVAGEDVTPSRIADRLERQAGVRPDEVVDDGEPAAVQARAQIAGGLVADLRDQPGGD